MKPDSPKRFMRSLLTRVAYIAGVVLVLVLAGEITARVMGYRPWQPTEQSLVVKPEGRFFQEDSLLGYKGRPGRFELRLQDSLDFVVTHNAEGWRKTALDSLNRDSLPQIWILGCSFTHGYGVNDADNYPTILQQKLPGYRVCNYGMDGYGTLQSWLLLRDLLRQGRRPHTVILAYGAFHDQRNTANRYWHKALHGQRIADDIRYPYIRLDKNDSLHIHYGTMDYRPLPLQGYLALTSLIEERWNRSEENGLRSRFVTEVLIQRIADASHQAGAHFLLAGIYRHPETTSMLHTFKLEGMQTLDISQDLDRPEQRILPGNGHPNAAAHQAMAESLAIFLQSHILQTHQP